jgi:ribosome maturation factor RimP
LYLVSRPKDGKFADSKVSADRLTFFCIRDPVTTPDLQSVLFDLTNRLLADGDRYVVDVEVKGNPGSLMIWIYIDSEKGGVGIDECASLSREVLFHLESVSGVPQTFTLNVSSPGLDRPLQDIRQFKANIGRMASVKWRSEGTAHSLKGRLVALDGDRYQIIDEKGGVHWFDRGESTEIKIIPVFK